MSERVIQSAEEMQALMQRYSHLGMLAVGSDNFVTWYYDQIGNELKVIVKVGELMRFEETPRKRMR